MTTKRILAAGLIALAAGCAALGDDPSSIAAQLSHYDSVDR